MDSAAWHPTVHGVAESQTWLSNWTELNFDKCAKEIQWRQDKYVNKWYQINHISVSYKEQLQPKIYILYKINSKRSTQNGSWTEIVGNNRKINLWVLRPSEYLVLDFTPKTNLFFFKVNNWNASELKSSALSKWPLTGHKENLQSRIYLTKN